MLLVTLGYILISLTAAANDFKLAIDLSQPITSVQARCLAKSKVETAFIRAYSSYNNGMFDFNVCNTFHEILYYQDTMPIMYMEPNALGKNGSEEFYEMFDAAASSRCGLGYFIKTVYVWVSNRSNWIIGNDSYNMRFLEDIIDAAGELNITIGFYTDESAWEAITGFSGRNGFKSGNHPLWYNNASSSGDNAPNLNNFKPFGGWTAKDVQAVQSSVNQNLCQIPCNKDNYREF